MAVEWGPGDIALHVPQLAKDVFNPLGRLCKRFKERFAELYHHPAEHEIRLLNCCPPFPTHRDNNGDVDDNSGVEEEEGGGQGLRRRSSSCPSNSKHNDDNDNDNDNDNGDGKRPSIIVSGGEGGGEDDGSPKYRPPPPPPPAALPPGCKTGQNEKEESYGRTAGQNPKMMKGFKGGGKRGNKRQKEKRRPTGALPFSPSASSCSSSSSSSSQQCFPSRRMTETLRVPEMRARMMEAARDLAYFVKMASIIAIPELYGLAFSQGARLASAQLKRSVEQALSSHLLQRFSSGLRVVFARIHRLTDERLAEYLSTPSTHRAQLNLKALGVSKYLQLDGDDEGGGGDAIVSAAGIAKKMGGGGAGGRRRRKSGTAATAAAAAISQPKLRSGRRPKSGSIDEQQGGRTAKSAESNAADASASFRAYTPPPRPGMKDDDDVDSHHDDDPSWVNKPHHVDNDGKKKMMMARGSCSSSSSTSILARYVGAYAPAVELFKGLNTAWTPAQVLRLLSMSARRLCECVDAHSTKKSVIGADDVLLLFVFMIAKAQVPDIHARVDMADIFMNSLQRSSVDGYYLATIQAALDLLRNKMNQEGKEKSDNQTAILEA